MCLDEIYHFVRINENLITSGQPTVSQLHTAANNDVQVVINLAALDSETPLSDEASLVRELGMEYVHIPVEWDTPTAQNYNNFLSTMQKNNGKKILVHCVANYRATAFFSLYAMQHLGWSKDQADALIASVWQLEKYPVWLAFIKDMRNSIV
jgi:protein tyrosine phosphatase (PTP) superfamily phosphohydrolase (DUF442 family)